MNIELRITRSLFESIHADLSRPHAFAAERVGFISCASGKLEDGGLLLLAEGYHPVADGNYVNDPRVGAMMGAAAIRTALQLAYNQPVSMLHVHRHEHYGHPAFSRVDLRESHKLIPDFFKVQPTRSHGAIVLSYDSFRGLCWSPGGATSVPIGKMTIVGRPTTAVGRAP